jgi:hypothetical protein
VRPGMRILSLALSLSMAHPRFQDGLHEVASAHKETEHKRPTQGELEVCVGVYTQE